MQFLQQQVIFKQMQEMQRQQQFKSFTDTNQNSGLLKNVDGVQYSPIINGTPVHNTSNIFTNWGQQSDSPATQRMAQYGGDEVQQHGGSFYDSPIPNAGSNLNQIYFQGISGGSPMQQQPVAHSTHSFSGGQNLHSSNQDFTPRQEYSMSNVYGQVHQRVSENNTFGNFEHVDGVTKNAIAYEINEKENGWLSNQLDDKSTHIRPSQGSATLDPLEEKILFSMDDNLWDISSVKSIEVGTGNPGNTLRSWSALMQSALAETSSSETGWSGLTFQNTDPSNDNQTSNFVESGHPQADCVENSMQPASALCATEYQYLNSHSMNFLGFHQAVTNNQSKQDRSLHSSHEQDQQFSQTGGRFESRHQQLSLTMGKPQSQFLSQPTHGWASSNYGHVESNPSQLHPTSANQQTNNTNFWSDQKSHPGTLVHNNITMNNFQSGQESRSSLVAETQNQENSLHAYAYQTNTADAMRDGVRMINQQVSNNAQAFDASSMFSNLNAAKPSVQGRAEANLSNAVNNSMTFQASNMASQRSHNVLQQLHYMNQSRVEGSLLHGNSITQGQNNTAASEVTHHNHPASQDSNLLPSPSQRFQNHNMMPASQNYWQQSVTPVPLSSVPNQSQLPWQHISRSAGVSQPIQNALYSEATRYANTIASPRQNSPRSAYANPFAQQYTGSGAHAASQLTVPPNLSHPGIFPSKPINQWTDVPIQKHSADAEFQLVQGSGLSDKQVEELISDPQNEQDTQDVTPSGLSAKPVMKYGEEKSHSQILPAVPESEIQESVKYLRSERNSSVNQMNILYGNQEDNVLSTNTVVNQCLAITRPNKRKSRTSELLAWHKEVAKISVTFPDTRMGEREWAQASNLLMEVANEAELRKFGQTIIRPRKRLILTTQLIQTLLHPAPLTILSMDPASTYECIAYIVARCSLGDACNMSPACVKTDLANNCDAEEKYLCKVLENFSKRIKRLGDVLQRSDEIPAIVDISVDSKDLERFSVINRFAKFHSRPQPNPSEPFSSGLPKIYPQRYVSAFPMPKDIPDGLQCISL